MAFSSGFKRQHAEILTTTSEISACLEETNIIEKSDLLLSLLAKLTGKLTAHLAMEDRVLYPKLYEHKDQRVRSTAQQFFSEMGDLSELFKNYVGQWASSESIRKKPKEFIEQTNTIFQALSQRIDREDNELYPLADKN